MASPACNSEPVCLSPREVASTLSMREFLKLCALVDAVYGTAFEVVSYPNGVDQAAEVVVHHRPDAIFSVLDIVRDKDRNVTICADRGGGVTRFTVK